MKCNTINMLLMSIVLFLSAALFSMAGFAQEEQSKNGNTSSNGEENQTNERVSGQDSASNFKQLTSNLSSLLSTKYLNGTRYGIAIYSVDKNQMIYEKNASDPLTPASTTKLFFTYAALSTVGSNYYVPTNLYTDGTIQNGTINGNVYIVGRGDALLSVNDIEQLSDQLRQKGIHTITGDIVGDGNFFDSETNRQMYSGDNEEMQAMPPISALGLNKNLVNVLVTAGSAGTPRVQTYPTSDGGFEIVYGAPQAVAKSSTEGTPDGANTSQSSNTQYKESAKQKSTVSTPQPKQKNTQQSKQKQQPKKTLKKTPIQSRPETKTSKKKKRADNSVDNCTNQFDSALLDIIPESNTPIGDYKMVSFIRTRNPKSSKSKRQSSVVSSPRLRVISQIGDDGVQRFYVIGTPSRNTSQSYTFEIKNPTLCVAGTLKNQLTLGGITVLGKVREGRYTGMAKPISQFGRPIIDIINIVNKYSDNYLAEHIMKIVGGHSRFANGDDCLRSANTRLRKILDSLSVQTNGLDFFDGSGLSRRNKTSALTQVQLLRKAMQQTFGSVFYNSLAIAGYEGTLRGRLIRTQSHGLVHAKTGTHANVSALSGYTRTRDGERICYSFIWNGNNVYAYKSLENLLVNQLSEFSYVTGTLKPSIMK